jgi:hypothetical protein
MSENDFEGSLILEKLAETGKVDAFFTAVDADDFEAAKRVLRSAGIDAKIIQAVIKKMEEADGEL